MNFSLDSTWWRFSQYEISRTRAGDLIAPTPGAPLESYALHRLHGDQPPYIQLFRAVTPRTKGAEDPAAQERGVLEWCTRFGLLALALDGVSRIMNPAKWVRHRVDDLSVRAVATEHVFLPSGWKTVEHDLGESAPADEEGLRVPARLIPDGWPQAGVVRRAEADWSDRIPFMPGERTEAFSPEWMRHFPSVKAAEEIPPPHSAAFWQAYAEPLDRFLAVSSRLHTTVRSLVRAERSAADPRAERPASATERAKGDLAPAEWAALVLPDTTDIRVGFLADGDNIAARLAFPSLLPWLGLAAVADVQAHRLFECPVCLRLFFSEAWQARYCSPTCKHTADRRRQRAKATLREDADAEDE